ncbi:MULTISPECIES: hypothetical protein [Bacillus]|nr:MULTISPECIES: hypothetical protein [Bacillus]
MQKQEEGIGGIGKTVGIVGANTARMTGTLARFGSFIGGVRM